MLFIELQTDKFKRMAACYDYMAYPWHLLVVLFGVCDSAPPDSLRLVWLANTTFSCNDGSPAGYYFRRGINNDHWVVYLEGGGYCWDTVSCKARWRRRPSLMSSTRWPRARRAPALLSADPSANPLWHDSNHVLLPYCSSDMWAGTRSSPHLGTGFHFAGRLIVRAVLSDLVHYGLKGRMLLVGSSAGGAGVMLHADAARRALRSHDVRVAAIADSAQLAAEGVRAPRTRSQWDAVHQTGAALRVSLASVRAAFAPACLAHGALARPEWLAINVSGITLPRAIACWEQRIGSGRRKTQAGCAPRKLIERCTWPQCNGSCPRLRDPRTGEEVALAVLLQSFGLDVRGAAAAMGLDARQLSRMSRAELLPLLAPHL
ncbi:unnamed protein product [Arctia plantaginis]|uniref:Palmitoleoyl-protein carboxylesterase NOTUM n=1 Tax=Arctia plantaginis TaxID=874455 RepID=A0A8S1BAC3_ARCPL|nr:unnamed protein product [Arctia plantaginis]